MLNGLQSFWNDLDPRRKLIAGLGALAILAAVFGIARVASAPSMALLYSGLDAAAAGEVVAALEARGVPYEVRDDAIYVDGAARDETRMALATEGLPASGPAGYELLDSLTGFGTTSQMFDAAYWRAKEGELARTITASPNVRSARVHLANPVSQPFSRTPLGTASVTVTMARGTLDEAQAQAIRYLVSSAVTGLAPSAVTVIESGRGVVLGGPDENGLEAAANGSTERAEALRLNVQRLLEARVGPGRAIVEVSVDTAMDSETISERVIDPASRVAISNDTEESQEQSSGPAPGVTVASNLPDGDAAPGGESSSSATATRERQNFEVSETRRERVITPGQVRRISVAVMIDGLVGTAPDGTPEWRPRPPEEIETLRTLVQTAVGYDPARGDTVTIESLQFTALPDEGSLAERSDGWLANNGTRLAQIGMLGAIVLALIFFVLRPIISRRPVEPLPELTGPQALALDDARAIGVAEATEEEEGDIFDVAPQRPNSKIDRLREVIANRTEDSAQIIRSWIEQPDPTTQGG